MISGPMPSPGRIRICLLMGSSFFCLSMPPQAHPKILIV
jgi:hypothetical protein